MAETEQLPKLKSIPDQIFANGYAHGVEDSAKVAEAKHPSTGRFIVEDSPEANFGKAMAACIRRLIP